MAVNWKTFRALWKHTVPSWLNEGEGGQVGFTLSLLKDAFMNRVYLGFLAGYPQNGPNGETAPPDALIRIGQDRRCIRGIFETDAEYAYRLTQQLVERQTAGNPFTLMRQLHAYTGSNHGVSFRTVDVAGNFYSRSSSGVETASLATGLWDWDAEPSTKWSKFWVIIYPGTLWSATTDEWADGGTWGDPDHVWGIADMTPEHATSLRAIVNDWKPDGTRCQNIIVAFDPASFDPSAPEPDGLWGHWSKVVAGVRVPSRLSTARYLAGR